MLHELAGNDAHRVRPLFTGPLLSLTIDAVIAGNTPARLWADDLARPAAGLMWDTRHGYYLVGAPTNSSSTAATQIWVAEQVGDEPFYAKIHYHPVAWETVVPLLF